MAARICKCGTAMITKRGNIAAFQPFAYPIWGSYEFCPNAKWWNFLLHSDGHSWLHDKGPDVPEDTESTLLLDGSDDGSGLPPHKR
jgi:hypothetical protein